MRWRVLWVRSRVETCLEDEGRRLSLLLTVLGFGFAIALPAVIVSSSYFGHSVSYFLSYDVDDGWCNAATQGVGAHCFGDFQFVRLPLEDHSIWLTEPNHVNFPYLPTALVVNVAAFWLQELGLGVRGSLIFYLTILAASVLTPSIWVATRVRKQFPAGVIVSFFGAMTLPFFTVLDRGNSMGFAVAPLLGFFVGLRRGPRWFAPACLVVAVMFRPQFAILGLAFLVVGRWRDIIFSALGFLAIAATTFLVWPYGGPPGDFAWWRRSLEAFEGSASPTSFFPVNLSAARSVVLVLQPIKRLSPDLHSSLVAWVVAYRTLISLVVVGVVAVLFVWLRDRMPIIAAAVLLLVSAFIAPAVQFGYNLTLVLVLTALIAVPSGLFRVGEQSTSLFPRTLRRPWFVVVLLSILISLVPIPFARAPGHQSIGLEMAGPLWLLVWCFTIVCLVGDQIAVVRQRRLTRVGAVPPDLQVAELS